MKFEEEIFKLSARVAVLEDHAGLSPLAHELPPVEVKPDLGPVVELPTPVAIVTRNPEGDPLAKTSGDDEDAGDWTTTGDGTDYPKTEEKAPE